jgi:hypothetical protein
MARKTSTADFIATLASLLATIAAVSAYRHAVEQTRSRLLLVMAAVRPLFEQQTDLGALPEERAEQLMVLIAEGNRLASRLRRLNEQGPYDGAQESPAGFRVEPFAPRKPKARPARR